MGKPKYKRVLLKLSGEALAAKGGFGIDADTLASVAREIADTCRAGVQIGIVVGAGNFFRGASAQGRDRVRADHMGMAATVINAAALEEAIIAAGAEASVLSAVPPGALGTPWDRRAALSHLESGRAVILAGGTGNPYFTTDTAAALRAAELGADVILKATRVDGVYDRDPIKASDARRFERLSYREVLEKDLKVMDAAAVVLCRENSIPIRVFDMTVRGNIARAASGEDIGTIVTGESHD